MSRRSPLVVAIAALAACACGAVSQGTAGVGDEVVTDRGLHLTLLSYRDHLPLGAQAVALPSGSFWAGGDLKVCNDGPSFIVNPIAFQLVEPDGSKQPAALVRPRDMAPLTMTRLETGECASGWIFWTPSAAATAVIVTRSDVRWTLG